MKARSLRVLSALLGATLLLAGCGGSSGGSTGPNNTLTLQSVQVATQTQGPLSPFGDTRGGDELILTGTGFINGLTVQIGASAAQVQTVTSSQAIVTSPPGPEGFADVTMINPGGARSTLQDTFQYVAPPAIVELKVIDGPTAPEDSNRAPIAGGVTVRITGVNFKVNATVTVGATPAATTVVGPDTITFRAPSTDFDISLDVVVANSEGLSSTLPRGLVYTQEFSLETSTQPLSQTRARHLMRRAGFGAAPPVIDAAVAAGLITTVNRLLDFSNDDGIENVAIYFYGTPPPPKPGLNTRTNKDWWLHLMVENPNPLQDRMAWFLHEHFATSERGFSADARWFLHEQVKLFRRFSLSSADALADGSPGLNYDWRELLVEICKDRAMLEWLDGRQSRVGNPNENFAREFWELFVLGEGNNYTEADIQNAARAFTGFYWYRPGGSGTYLEMRYRPSLHDPNDKTIFGVTGTFGYDDLKPFSEDPATSVVDEDLATDANDLDGGVVALTLRQRPVEASRFICRKLAEFFLYDDVHDMVVDDLALRLRTAGGNQWNLKPILERILRSKAMFSARAMKGKVKNPVEFGVGFLRTTDVDLNPNPATAAAALRGRLERMGQVVLDPPDVNGWPEGEAWLGSQAMLERVNFLNYSVMQLDSVPNQIEPLLPPVGSRSPLEMIDHLADVLDVDLTTNARAHLIDYMNTEMVGAVVMPFNFDPTNDAHLKEKTRGLIWQIAQYHDGHQK